MVPDRPRSSPGTRNAIAYTIKIKNEITIMSANSNEYKTPTRDMDDDEQRIQGLTEALSLDEDATTSPNTPSTVTSVKSKNKSGNVLNRLKANRSSSSTPDVNPNANVNRAKNQSQNASVNATSNSNGFRVEGSNIGSRASEPDWTNEDLQAIADACGKRIETIIMAETRRSTPDPQMKYLAIMSNGTVVSKPASWLPDIDTSEFKIGMGRVKPDEKTGKGKLYTDIVMKGPNWVLNQWTSKNVIMEGVPDNILDKPPRMINGRPERRIGHDFARIGLPKLSFAPIFETLKSSMPAVMDSVSITRGYYWINASWGVTGNPGSFAYKNGTINQRTPKLYEAMKMLSGMSSMGVATIAVSIGNESKLEGGKMIPDPSKYEFSIKIHNMLHLKRVSYHSPPQSSSTGFEVPDELMNMAESLEPVSNVGAMFTDTSSAFASTGANPFFNATAAMGQNTALGPGDPKMLI